MANSVDTGSPITAQRSQVVPLRSAATPTREAASGAAPGGAARQLSAEGGNARPAEVAAQSRESAERVREATRDVSDYIQTVSRSLQISVDDELGSPVVQVLDTETDEVIRQIPTEEVLEIARFLRGSVDAAAERNAAAIKGLLVDQEG